MANSKKSSRRANARNGRVQRLPRDPKSLSSYPVHRIRRTIDSGAVSVAVADQGAVWYFTPAALASWSDFSNLYDMYRVSNVTYRYVCWRAAQPALTGESFPTMFLAQDFNDTVNPASAAELLDYGACQIHQFAEGLERTYSVSYVPRLQFQTAAATAVLSDPGWAKTSSTTDLWLGHKIWLRDYNTTTYNNTVVQVYITVDLEFKVTK